MNAFSIGPKDRIALLSESRDRLAKSRAATQTAIGMKAYAAAVEAMRANARIHRDLMEREFRR